MAFMAKSISIILSTNSEMFMLRFCPYVLFIDIFNSLLLLSLSLALTSKLPRIVYRSVVYLQVQAKVTLKVTN